MVRLIIKNFLERKVTAIDGTLGNGHDTDFLADNFEKVYAFDIQKQACDNDIEKNIQNVTVINDSHSNFEEYIKEEVERKYLSAFPEMEGKYSFHVCDSADGMGVKL